MVLWVCKSYPIIMHLFSNTKTGPQNNYKIFINATETFFFAGKTSKRAALKAHRKTRGGRGAFVISSAQCENFCNIRKVEL